MNKRFCYSPFQNLEICVYNDSLSAFPCCPNWSDFYKFGTFDDSNLNDIWNSKNAQILREKILNNDYSLCNQNVCPFIMNKNFEPKVDENLVCEPFMKTSPLIIKFSHDSDCNIACNFCREKVKRNTKEQNEKYDSYIEKIMPFIKDTKIISLNGCGEALASEPCKKLIKRITTTYKNIEFDLLTNGTLCTKERFEELGLMNRIKIIRLSLNAACTETYDKVVPSFGFWFEKIIKNMEFLHEMKKQKDYAFHVQMVVTVDNFRDIPEFIKLAKRFDAFARFWQFYPEICSNSKDLIKRLDIFNPNHEEYQNLIEILKQDILSEEHVILSPLIQSIRKNSNEVTHYNFE